MSDHKHAWTVFISPDVRSPGGTTVISRSPSSTADDVLGVAVQQEQGCECGTRSWRTIGWKDVRFRGDDECRAAGQPPLGTLRGALTAAGLRELNQMPGVYA